MFPSSTLCRAQETFQRDRAAGARLENVRIVATDAAIAWGREALSAERREARHVRDRTAAGLALAQKRQSTEEHDRLLSENPDRGFESP